MDGAIATNLDETCRFYLPKKKRFCRLQKIKTREYCVQHVEMDSGNISDERRQEDTCYRMQCPLDPSHTCDKRKLQKHLKNCNKTKLIPNDPWYVAGINSGENESDANLARMLKDVAPEEIQDLIIRIRDISTSLPHLGKNDVVHPSMKTEISEFGECENAMKKLTQNSSLLAVLDSNDILMCPCNYIEFGAGRGQLTTSIIKAMPEENISKCGFVLVDRSTTRRKLDAKYRQIGNTQVVRLRTDIRDLCLEKFEVLQSPSPVVGVSKHLCGCATDLSLRCMVNSMYNIKFCGALIALCCHHRCNWSDYVGKNFFLKHSLSPRDFSVISLMSSWAVCCFRENKGLSDDIKGPLHFITDKEKEEIGVLCKRVIDAGRVDYLLKLGFDAKLIEYADKSITLENIALVFTKIGNKS